jgi:hypothetical protein
MKMNQQHDREPDHVAQARKLLAAAKQGVEQLEIEASQAFCRLTALAGMMIQIDKLSSSDHPDAVDAVAFYAATVCRDAKILLRYINSREWVPLRIPAISNHRERPRAALESTSS